MGTDTPFCSLVVPCYNEAGSLSALLQAFAALPAPEGGFELIVVDNGSTDGTAELLRKLLPDFPFARAVTVPVNRGYGYGITQGLLASRGLYAGWTHGDLQYPPSEVFRAMAALPPSPGGKVLLKGLRGDRSLPDLIFTSGMSLYESLLFGLPLRDINAQPTLFHRSLLDSWGGAPDWFTLDLFSLVTAYREGFQVKRLPVRMDLRKTGRSSWNTGLASRLRLSLEYFRGSLRLRRELSRQKGQK